MTDVLARIGAWLRELRPRTILIVGWLAFLVHAYPGLMTRDSFDQLAQGRSGLFSDDHPPLMQAIVWVTDRIIAGPFGIVLLQTAMFLAGAYLLLARAMRPRTAAVVAVALMMFPPISAVMVVMWKDPLMAGALMLATALLVSTRRAAKVAGLALVVVATGVRFNALAATFAIVVLLFDWARARADGWRHQLARYGTALGVWLATIAVAFGINTALTDRETHFFHTTLVGDIVGTLYYVDGVRTDTSLKRALEGTRLRVDHDIHARMRAAYRSDGMFDLVVGDGRLFDLPLADVEPPPPELRDALMRAWKAIVYRNLAAYLRYRVDQFRVVIGITKPGETSWDVPLIVTHAYQDPVMLRQAGVPTGYSRLQSAVDSVLSWCSHTALFRPWVYLVASLILLGIARKNRIALALLLSGIGVELSLFFLAHSIDYRYSHWLVCTTLLGAIMLFVDRRRRA